MNTRDNPFRNELEVLLNKIVELKGSFFHIENILQRDLKNKGDINPKFKKREIAVISHLAISDISGPTENGWEIIFPTNIKREVFWNRYKEEIERLISREACFLVAQGCEAFLHYFKNIIAIYFYLHVDLAKAYDSKFSDCESIDDFKYCMRKSRKVKATSSLFKILEDNCSDYTEINQVNNLDISFSEYYQALAFFRHKVTHSSSTFSDKELEERNWSAREKSILYSFFPYKKEKSDRVFVLNKFSGQNNLKRTAEVGFQIYKALSMSDNYEWEFEKQKL